MAGARPPGWRMAACAGAVAGALAAGLLGGCGGPSAARQAACGAPTWVAAWSADASDTSNVGMVDQTVRTILTPHLGGDTVRVQVSNRLGAAPVSFGAGTVGLRQGAGADLVTGSRRALRFGGHAGVTLAAGTEVDSDPVALRLRPAQDLAVSLFAARATGPATEHTFGQQTSYFTPPGSGDHAGDEAGSAYTLPTRARYFLSAVDVRTTAPIGVVVALGDSITDGFGGPPDGNDRYSDFLAARLSTQAPGLRLGVVNAGISGNRILTDARQRMGGLAALDRLDRDVIAQPGVSDVIVLEGINDIAAGAASDQVTGGLGRLVARLHTAGLRVQLGTLTPFGGGPTPAETTRLAINRWIRSPGRSDGVVDFDAALRDPAHPDRMAPGYDSGDHLHPDRAGRRAMAEAVDLAQLGRASCRVG